MFGSRLVARSERIRGVDRRRRSFVGHAGLIQSSSFVRFGITYSIAASWKSGAINSCENSGEENNLDSGIHRSIQQEGARGGKRDSGRKNSVAMMEIVEVTSTSVRSASQHARWGGATLVSIEALAVLLVTAVLVQLRFSSLFPRILLILSNSFSFLLHKTSPALETKEPTQVEKVRQKTFESLEEEGFKIPNLDNESARRETRSVYKSRTYEILGIVPDEEVDGLKITEKYERNSRNIEIFCKRWIPKTGKVKAAVCFCHGYGDTCTFFFEGIARKLASKNFAVFGMDYAGFGLSEGLHGYIPSFDLMVDGVSEHYSSLKKEEEFKDIPFFLMGESMGGAVALKSHFSMPTTWDGAVLIAPMCKISEEMYPPWYLLEILKVLARIVPKAKLVPSGDIAEIGFQDVQKRQQAMENIIAYVGKPRLGTALSLLKATDEIEAHLDKVSLPLLILHGAEDRVTDPAVSKLLYEQACSQDKTLYLYENLWHAVLEGETDEVIDKAIGDIVEWLDAHSAKRPN